MEPENELIAKYHNQARLLDMLLEEGCDKGQVCVVLDFIDNFNCETSEMENSQVKKNFKKIKKIVKGNTELVDWLEKNITLILKSKSENEIV